MEVFYVNNQEPQSRMQRYNFNTDDNPKPKRKRPKKPHRIRQLIISFLVTLALIIGIGVWLANRSTTVENSNQSTEQTVSDSSSSSDNDSDESDDSSQSDQNDSGTTDSNDDTASGSTYGDQGITSKQRSSLQSSINQESDAAIKDSEQKKLNDTKRKSSAESNSSSANTTSDSSSKQSNDSTNSDSITFSQSHTFSSVADAKSWAQATKSQWLNDGYTNYTITSDAQGNFVLKFTK